ncbi:porin family protein [Lacinutrix chionoecetis]
MKKHLILSILFFSILLVNAQDDFYLGAKGGLNYSGFHTENGANTDNFGIAIGAFADIEVNALISIHAELLFNQKGGLIPVRDAMTDLPAYAINTKLSYIDLPVYAKLNFIDNFGVLFGPQIGFLINSKGEIESNDATNGEAIAFSNENSIDVALNAGLSYDISDRLLIQATYSYGLMEVFEDVAYKNSVISLSIGYKLY